VPKLATDKFISRAPVFSELQARVSAVTASGRTLEPLHIGDTYLEAPTELSAGAGGSLRAAYGPTAGRPELRALIAKRAEQTLGASYKPESEVLLGSGGTHAFQCAARAVLGDGDEVVALTPYWPLVPGVFGLVGAKVKEVDLGGGVAHNYPSDPAERSASLRARLLAACTAQTKAVYFATPNNPDGHVLSDAELQAIAAVASEKDLWIFSDEVYAELVFEGAHQSMTQVEAIRDQLIVIGSLSKSLALAGLRVGYVLAPEAVVEVARRVSTHTVFNVPVPIQEAAERALLQADAFLARARPIYMESRALAISELTRHGFRFRCGAGATYCFVDLTTEAEKFAAAPDPLIAFLHAGIEQGVLLAPGEAFGAAYRNWARLCFTAAPKERVCSGIEALARAR
jgi:aspartate/methionine/tyrosine aminotransferase